MLNVKIFVFSPFQENTYLVWDEKTADSAIIDPGCLEIYEQEELRSFVENSNLKIKYHINTHCHIDHIFGNAFVKHVYAAPFYAPEKDLFLIEQMEKQAAAFGVSVEKSPMPEHHLTEELILKLGEEDMEFLFTPGHTPGEYSIYFPNSKFCITGDVLFLEGIGRTDLWGGNLKTLLHSIKSKLFTLPDETIVYPGHGDSSTIGHEKVNNPYLY